MTNLLTLAGLAIRPATPADERFIHLDWTRSAERPFMLGAYQPFAHLETTVQEAKDNRNVFLLRAIYRREIASVIRNHGPARMVYDVDNPDFYAAWGCPEWVYVKSAFRGQGIARELRCYQFQLTMPEDLDG